MSRREEARGRQLIVVEFVEELRAAGVQGRQLCGLSERMELIVSELRAGQWQQAMPQLAEMKMACPQSAAVEEAIAIGEVLNNHPQQAQAALVNAAKKRPGDARLAALSRRVTLATRSKDVETGQDKPSNQDWQAHFHRGAVLDGWTVTGQLGAGGGGMVFRIEKDDRVRAMKVLPAELSNDPAFAAQFRQEILTLRGLSKLKHIVQFHDFNRHLETGCWYFQMEYVEGESLQTRLDRQGTIPIADALQMVLQLASDEGLGAVHAQNLCHRDIKPGNILLRPDGSAVLVDFGVAGSASATLTSANSITGFTAKFAAPEQLRHQPATTASDVFSLMGTFCYAVTGEFPEDFDADDLPPLLQNVRTILANALQLKPAKRLGSAPALFASLCALPMGAPYAHQQDGASKAAMIPIAEGMCEKCRTRNDTTRKFCKACAAALRCACLGCENELPVWDEVCDNCGSRQSHIVQAATRACEDAICTAKTLGEQQQFDAALQALRIITLPVNSRLDYLRATLREASDHWQELERQFLSNVREAKEAERLCSEAWEIAQQRIAELAKRDQIAEALEACHDFRAAATQFGVRTIGDQAGNWVSNRIKELDVALSHQRRQDEELLDETTGNFEARLFGQIVERLKAHPATIRNMRLYSVLDEAQNQIARIEAIRSDIRLAIERQEYDGLSQTLQELERDSSPLSEREALLIQQLTNWEQLDPELRRAVSSHRGLPVLNFQPGDVNGVWLQNRLRRVVASDQLWRSIGEQRDSQTVFQMLENVLVTDPHHLEAKRKIEPFYQERGWNVCKFNGHSKGIVNLSFSPDGRKISSIDTNLCTKTWSLDEKCGIR